MWEEGLEKQKKVRVLIATPYESQIKELWLTYTALIADSPLLARLVTKIRKSDIHSIEFENGSTIEGHTIGISSSNRGTSLRSLSADIIFLDEMDFIPRDIIEEAILPIWTTHVDCKLRICSTPSGARDLFYEWCTKADELGWFHRHAASWHPDNTNWMSIAQAKEKGLAVTESTEFQVKAVTSQERFEREYGAEFGEELGGVYKHHYITKSMTKYGRAINIENELIFDPGFEQNSNHLYIIGVDWNTYANGGQIVVVEYCTTPTFLYFFDDEIGKDVTVNFTGKYRLFYRIGVKSKEATQRKTREEIIRLMSNFKIDFVYVDYGAGDTNIEELTFYGKSHPGIQMSEKLRVIDAGAVVEHYDPILRTKVNKRNKSMMVNFSTLYLEEGLLALPKEEDQKNRLIGQMRGYQIKNTTARGDYSYVGDDHILDAFNLAIYGFQLEYGSLLKSHLQHNIIRLNDPRVEEFSQSREQNSQTNIFNLRNVPDSNKDPEKMLNAPQTPRRITMPTFGKRGNIGNFGTRSRSF